MFLYWRKRGAYELEALPSALAGLELGAVERFSWSSTLDIIEDLGGRCGPLPKGRQGLPPGLPGHLPLVEACGWHRAHATVSHSLSRGVGTRASPESRCCCWRRRGAPA